MSPAFPPPPPRRPDPRRGSGPGRGAGPWPGDGPRQGAGPRSGDGPGQGAGPWQGQGPSRGPGRRPGPGPSWGPAPPQRPAAHRATALPVAERLQAEPALLRLRAAHRRPVFTVTGAVIALYLLNGLLASEARGVMAVPIAGPLNTGLALSLLQCVTTVWAVRWYARHARTRLDPDRSQLRDRLDERGEAR
ncbi:DUF485 domain-containing protein [Streptomyces caeni]|uniref:DUF485 domain-containing protein n=1 Tax=Streptomyces caeni TaxID=2307231 RepID=A0ABW4IYG9_9ACTN